MLNSLRLNSSRPISQFEVPVVAATLSIPIVLFSVMGYDINPAFLLAPFIALALLTVRNRVTLAFLLAGLCGVASVLIANTVAPDSQVSRHFLSLTLIMFAPSFIFLGRYLARREGIQRVWFWLSFFSAIFVIVVTARILILGEAVRIYLGPLGFAAMNAEFLGLPVFATFGVLSLANLICLQMIILCGAVMSGSITTPIRWFFFIGLICAAFLVIGSDSRSTQVLILWLLASIGLCAWRYPLTKKWACLTVLAVAIAGGITIARGMAEVRMIESIESLASAPTLAGKNSDGEKSQDLAKLADTFSSGRVELAIMASNEARQSPIIGNGFAGYSRYSGAELSSILAANKSTHIYYLTLFWKGGILFFTPFMGMLLMNFLDAWKVRSQTKPSSEKFFAWSLILMAFGPMAVAWDILIVPSAGALAFFLFGLLSDTSKSNFVAGDTKN